MRVAAGAVCGIPVLALAFTTLAFTALALTTGCAPGDAASGGGEPAAADAAVESGSETPAPQHSLSADQTHNRWSRAIPPILTVQSGAVIEAWLEEASDQQLTRESTVEDLATLSFDPIHPLTGPVYVEGAEPGDLLAVTLHEIELGDWGWVANVPGFGFLADRFPDPYLRIFEFEPGDTSVGFAPGIRIPLRPFPGVMGVAPDTDSMLVTIPPRQNGGNMDDRDLVEGTTVYFPVLVEGALFSLGDPHIAQGDGEVGGTAIEGPLRVVYELEVIKGAGPIPSPHYETDEFYAVTGFAPTIDEAARNAVEAMVDHLVSSRDLSRQEAYALASMAGDLKISEVVDVPNMLVAMRISKDVIGN